MPLVSAEKFVQAARENGYAVGGSGAYDSCA